MRSKPTESTKHDSYGTTKTEATIRTLHGSVLATLQTCSDCLASSFYWNHNSLSGVISDYFDAYGILFLLLGCFIQPLYEDLGLDFFLY